MKKKCIKWIFGAGAHGRITLDVWRSASPDAEFHFIDDNPRMHGKIIDGVPVDGGIQFLLDHFTPADEAVVAIGYNNVRLLLGQRLENRSLILGNAIHGSAVVMASARIGGGTMIFAQAVINTGANVGKHVIINAGAVVEHDSVIEDGALLGSGVSTGGRVTIGEGTFIGAGTTLAPRIKVGQGSVVGAGSVVVKDLPPRVLAYGVPAQVVREVDKSFDWSRLL